MGLEKTLALANHVFTKCNSWTANLFNPGLSNIGKLIRSEKTTSRSVRFDKLYGLKEGRNDPCCGLSLKALLGPYTVRKLHLIMGTYISTSVRFVQIVKANKT